MSTGNPFSIGFKAARANLVPGLIIQAIMIGMVLAYYFVEPSRGFFTMLAAAKEKGGYGFSFVSGVVAGSILPVIFAVLVLQRGRLKRENLVELLFLAAFWGIEGVCNDAVYRLQALIFGAHADFPTVLKKVLCDQFIYNPLFAAPNTLLWYEFKNRGFRFDRIRHVFTTSFYRTHTVPALCATWVVWFPVVSAIYSLPSLLQVPLFALALTFWVLMMAYITGRQHGPHAGADMPH